MVTSFKHVYLAFYVECDYNNKLEAQEIDFMIKVNFARMAMVPLCQKMERCNGQYLNHLDNG